MVLIKPGITLLLCLLTITSTFAQSRTLTGKVTDTLNEPLPGVNIIIKGTVKGTVTDIDGNYTLEANSEDILVFRFVGFSEQEITVGTQSIINVTMSEISSDIDEVVVIGYGVRKKSSMTGAVSTINTKDIVQIPVSSISGAMQGLAAGVAVTNNGGPGSDPTVRIRGNGSISFDATPLYVIDGFPSASNISSFDPNDIESIEVLKDASATAIYGSRAANGVIMITTKKAKNDGKVHVTLSSYYGIQNISKKMDLLNTNQFVEYATESALNSGTELPFRLQSENFDDYIYEGAGTTYAQTNTDWQDELFQKNASISQTSLAISSGNDKSKYYSSVGYFNQKGIMVKTGFERLNFTFNSDHKLNKRIKIGHNITYSTSDRENEKNDQGRSNVMHALRSFPFLPVTDPTKIGGYRGASNEDGGDPHNPIEIQNLFRSNTLTNKLFGTIFGEIEITDNLKFRSTAGLDYTNVENKSGLPIYNDGFNSRSSNQVTKRTNKIISKLFSHQLTFDKKWDNHYLNVIAVYEQQPYKDEEMYIKGNLATNSIQELTGIANTVANGQLQENTLLSYLGRINYDFKEKYLISVAIRRDGSSKFAPGKKWGNFPSVSLGWRVEQESFMESIEAISQLKLRFGYGETGSNGGIGNYDWTSVIGANTYYVELPGAYYNKLENKDLSWETSKMINIGFDLGLFDNKFTLTAEYFKKNTDNLIFARPIPESFGYYRPLNANVGSMVNKGFDFEMGVQINNGDFKSKVTANLSTVSNEVTDMYTEDAAIYAGTHPDFGNNDITITTKGEPIQSFYGYKVEGIFQTNAEAASSGQSSAEAGDINFQDISGPNGKPDGIIDSYDRTIIGNYLPDFSYGINYSGSFKNFDFTLFFQGTYGNDIYNGTKVLTEGMVRLFNQSTNVLNAWTPANPNTNIPRAIPTDPNSNVRVSDRFIEDGSYLRLKTLTIGYTLPKSILSSVGISSIRLYVSGSNLFTITDYTGYDPEVGSIHSYTDGIPNTNTILVQGIDYGFMPSPRTYIGGIQVNF